MVIKNIFANYIGTGLVGIVNLVSLAWLSKVYGLENWGIIAACIALTNFIGLAEFGISQIYISEYHKEKQGASIFRQYQYAISFMGLFGAVTVIILFCVAANYLILEKSIYIFKDISLLILTLTWAVLSLINNFYYTNLVASGYQIRQNIQWVSFALIKNTIGLLAGLYIKAIPNIYLLAFIVSTLAEIALNEFFLKNKTLKVARFNEMKAVFSKTRFLSVAIALGIASFYCDRVILPLLISPYEFGVYAIVVTLGLYFLQLQYPIIKGIFPLIAKNHHNREKSDFKMDLPIKFTAVSLVMAPPLLFIGYFSKEVLVWYSIPDKYIYQAQILLIGILLSVFLNAMYNIIYLELVIENKFYTILAINLTCLIISSVVLIALGEKNAFIAGAVSWTLVSVIQLTTGILSRNHEFTDEKHIYRS